MATVCLTALIAFCPAQDEQKQPPKPAQPVVNIRVTPAEAQVVLQPIPAQQIPALPVEQPIGMGLRAVEWKMLDRPGGPQNFRTFAAQEVNRVKEVCKLNDKQLRVLQIAAKGVAHRLQQAADAAAEQQARQQQEVVARFRARRGFVIPQPDRTPEFRKQLHTHKLWKRTLERTLTKPQRKQLYAAMQIEALKPPQPHLPVDRFEMGGRLR